MSRPAGRVKPCVWVFGCVGDFTQTPTQNISTTRHERGQASGPPPGTWRNLELFRSLQQAAASARGGLHRVLVRIDIVVAVLQVHLAVVRVEDGDFQA